MIFFPRGLLWRSRVDPQRCKEEVDGTDHPVKVTTPERFLSSSEKLPAEEENSEINKEGEV